MSAVRRVPDSPGKWLGANKQHAKRCRERWLARPNRGQSPSGHNEGEARRECGACRYWLPVVGLLLDTFGACSNPASPFDRTVQSARDGCGAFAQRIEKAPDHTELL